MPLESRVAAAQAAPYRSASLSFDPRISATIKPATKLSPAPTAEWARTGNTGVKTAPSLDAITDPSPPCVMTTRSAPPVTWENEPSIGTPCAALLVNEPVRSGQSIIYPHGDVIIVGSVASGAEIIAGGSIHVYGSLRGRAFAGTNGNTNARIFCSKFDAEMMVIDGLYKTADDFDLTLRGTSVQARLDRNVMNIEQMV